MVISRADCCDREALKRLKARYCYGIDQQDWTLWRDHVFAPDASLTVPSTGKAVAGVEAIIAWVTDQWVDKVSVHRALMPDLEIQSSTTARGRWAMDDRLYQRSAPGQPYELLLHGMGYYDETYVRLDCGWRILTTKLIRQHVEHAPQR
ncbi:bile-acid 7-alpha-dehydratase [Novosphingobium endophyticum]|uniref:Bile-acid 7-alpha-dehydratase n=1 Tax=Novosphingobium endophyticum TaxID=1955250 RepID=A0A916TWK7_9SPHN|nr:nuclear transport factor 2 family protein [Novosphingobium endophyticum]GGC16050.1 bile-acid 7-alpha-dehydratase [Novosphingobium endophyticum]